MLPRKAKNDKTLNKKILLTVEISEKTTQHVTTFVFVYKYLTLIMTKTTMKTNTTISSSIIALPMMMLFTLITRGDDHTAERHGRAIDSGVSRLAPGGALRRGLGGCGNFGTFLYSFLFFFSLLIRRNGRRTGRDAQKCVAIAGGESVAFLSRLVILVFGRRARLFLGALDDEDDDGFVRNSKFARENKTARLLIDTMMMIMIDYDDADDFYFLSLHLSRAHTYAFKCITQMTVRLSNIDGTTPTRFVRLAAPTNYSSTKPRSGGRGGAVRRPAGARADIRVRSYSIVEQHVVD